MNMDKSAEYFIHLSGSMGSKVGGLAGIYEITKKHIEWLYENIEWYDKARARRDNKYEMKHVGSTIFHMEDFLKEMTILSLSKVMEDLKYDAQNIFHNEINFRTDFSPPIMYHSKLKIIHHLGNVIKHNRSIIDRNSSHSAKYLVDNEGFENGKRVIDLELDYRSLIYYCYYALADTIGRFAKLTPRDYPEDEHKSINEFYNYMVPSSFKIDAD